jgi:ComF family protein
MGARSGLLGAAAGVSLLARLCAHALGELVGPSRCAACARSTAQPLAMPSVFCAACAITVERLAVTPLPRGHAGRVAEEGGGGCGERAEAAVGFGVPSGAPALRAFASYSGAMADAIRRYKYGGHVELARPLGHLLRAAARASMPRADLVVPVPLHPRRLAERGYDQVALLSSAVARELGVPHGVRALHRRRHTPRQAQLDRGARMANVEQAFVAARPLAGQRVLLVDDVATTGATLVACVAALRQAGAETVGALVVARTPPTCVEPE